MDLKPGEKLSWEGQFIPVSARLEFQRPGRVRLTAHYSYSEMKEAAVPDPEKEPKGKFAALPFFPVSSIPVEFEVIRPLEVALTAKKNVGTGIPEKPSLIDLFDVQLVNLGK